MSIFKIQLNFLTFNKRYMMCTSDDNLYLMLVQYGEVHCLSGLRLANILYILWYANILFKFKTVYIWNLKILCLKASQTYEVETAQLTSNNVSGFFLSQFYCTGSGYWLLEGKSNVMILSSRVFSKKWNLGGFYLME